MIRNLISCLLFALVFTVPATAHAQRTDFSGNWFFESQESVSGRLYSNGSPKTFKVVQTKDAITIDRTSAGADGKDITATESIIIGGKAVESKTASGRKKLVTLSWSADGTTFTELAELYNTADPTKMDFKITDTWRIEGGKLVLQRKNENFTNGEVWESKAYYSKNL